MTPFYQPYYQHDPRYGTSGIGDVSAFGVLVPPIGWSQLFGIGPYGKPSSSPGGKPTTGWGRVALVGGVIGLGVLGYFVYRHVAVTSGAVRKFKSSLQSSLQEGG